MFELVPCSLCSVQGGFSALHYTAVQGSAAGVAVLLGAGAGHAVGPQGIKVGHPCICRTTLGADHAV